MRWKCSQCRRITHVAISAPSGVWTLPPPNRHHNVLWAIHGNRPIKPDEEEMLVQGFVDGTGAFLTREAALIRARETGQLLPDKPIWGDELYSENLW